MDAPEPMPDDADVLRRYVRALTGLSTLSAGWTRSDTREIAEQLSVALSRAPGATVVYVRVGGVSGTAAVETARTPDEPLPTGAVRDIGRAIASLGARGGAEAPAIADPSGHGTLRVAVAPLGPDGDGGVVAVASRDGDFPGESDRLLLDVAAAQATIALQRRRLESATAAADGDAATGRHTVGPDGTILWADQAELELLGYAAEEYVGRHVAEFHVDQDVICDILWRLQQGHELRDVEARLRRKDGSIRHVLVSSTVVREAGDIVHTRCVTRDIVDRRRAEASGRRPKDLFTTLVEHIPDIVSRLDRELRFRYISPAVTPITGRPWHEYIGKARTNQGVPPEFVHERDALSHKVFETGQEQRLEFPIDTPSGRRFLETRFVPEFAPDGSVESLMTLVRDVTEQKRAEERLRLLWEAAAVLLGANDPDGMLRELFAKIGPHIGVDLYFNYVVDDGGGLRLASCEGVAADAARPIARLQPGQGIAGTVAMRRQPVIALDVQQSDDPHVQTLKSFGIRAYVCHPLLAEGRLLGTLSFASRHRERFDSDEVAFLETICHYVTVAYERLRLLNELKEADRRKDEFLATLAHELRNPMAPLRNAVQLLRREEPTQPRFAWGRDVIERQVEYLTRLIDDLMDISRITRNNVELRTRRVELSEIVTAAVDSSRPLIEQRGHALTVTLPPHPVVLEGDLVRLAQVFMNLLNNAAKYTERGGRISVTAELDGGDVVVRVADTGIGIAPEKLPRLFEMFFQVDRSLERSQGGLGVGLTLVRRLVELHGGRVSAHSDGVGRGSAFIVRLPTVVDPPGAAPVREPARDDRARAAIARRVLVVDDNRDAADSLAMVLQLAGHDVQTAYDGVDGVGTAERLRPEVVLLDIGMPRLNGYDAARRIRGTVWGKDVLLIALTGWGQEDDRRRTVEAGFDAHVVKPVDPDALLTLLGRLQRGATS